MFQSESLVAKLQHRSEAPEYGANDERNTPLQTLQGRPCAFDKSGIPISLVLCSLFSRAPWSSTVLLLFAVIGIRKDPISVILAFLQGLMSVRSGTFSVSKQIKIFPAERA